MSGSPRRLTALEDLLFRRIRKQAAEATQPLDIRGLLDEHLLPLRERLLTRLHRLLRALDATYYEDPNPILWKPIPNVTLRPGSTNGPITFNDLWARSPYDTLSRRRLQSANVGYVGFGGIQLSALLLARAGVGRFVVCDPDSFDATNGNRQALCFQHTLGRPKVEVAAQYLQAINSEIQVETYQLRCSAADLPRVLGGIDVLIDGTGDPDLRTELHNYARTERIPVLSWAWAGWEGQYLTFRPPDPLYYDVFDYSPYTASRGFHAAGLSLLNGLVAKDALALLLGDPLGVVVSYPTLASLSLLRTNPIQLCDVRRIRSRHHIG